MHDHSDDMLEDPTHEELQLAVDNLVASIMDEVASVREKCEHWRLLRLEQSKLDN
jgi:hypothetical protein